jgi:hypothetical protein
MRNFVQNFILVTVLALAGPVSVALAQYSAFDDPPQGGTGAASAGNQEISANKPEVDGGEIAAGQEAQVIVLLRNNTSSPVTLDRIEMAPSSNITARMTKNQCGQQPIKPNVECAVTVGIKGETTGKFRLGMLIYHNGKTQLSNVFVVGTVGAGKAGSAGGLPANEIEAFPNMLDFGSTKGRTPLVRSIALRNASSNTVKISKIELAASPLTGFSVSAPDCKELLASQACVATVTWSPLAEGSSQGVLVLRHDGPSGNLQIALKGEYEITETSKADLFPSAIPGMGLIVADRETVDFGSSVDGAASITVSLVNNGEKDVLLQQVKLAGSDNGLTLSTDSCTSGKVLSPYQGCALTVNWAPRRAGPVIDDIQILHDGARGVLVLPVRGTATKEAESQLPVMNAVSALPKLSKGALDESLVGGVADGKPNDVEISSGGNATSLSGYRVTSMSTDRAILAGPRGRLLVRNGVKQLIAGSYWKPSISVEGVKLSSDKDSVLLFFDRTMTAGNSGSASAAFPSTGTTSSSGSAGSGTTTP